MSKIEEMSKIEFFEFLRKHSSAINRENCTCFLNDA